MTKLLSEEKIEEIIFQVDIKFCANKPPTESKERMIIRAIEAAVLEAQSKQKPFPFSAERVTYHKAGAIGAIMPCGTMVTNVKEAYEAGQKAAPVVQPDCNTCTHRGRINGLSQETYCEQCKWHSGVDHYAAAEGKE